MTDTQFLNEHGPPPVWRRSRQGNLFRWWALQRLTVFEQPRGSGWWSWCIAGRLRHHRVEFSPRSYPSEGEAVQAVCDVINERDKAALPPRC